MEQKGAKLTEAFEQYGQVKDDADRGRLLWYGRRYGSVLVAVAWLSEASIAVKLPATAQQQPAYRSLCVSVLDNESLLQI